MIVENKKIVNQWLNILSKVCISQNWIKKLKLKSNFTILNLTELRGLHFRTEQSGVQSTG